MRCLGLRLLNCRLWQPAWLAVVLIPLAIPSRGATADQTVGQEQQWTLAAADRLHDSPRSDGDGHRESPRVSTACWQYSRVGRSSAEGGVGVVVKAAWPPGKSHLPRRGGERWTVASLGSFAAMSPGLVASAGPMPKAPSALPAEYALLRRLEL